MNRCSVFSLYLKRDVKQKVQNALNAFNAFFPKNESEMFCVPLKENTHT